ncbi:MAG: DNA polymerase III subunit delta' [Gammaproteobacteria bacterium]|nr:MAG: DNA polymerase III subunit delta' [Gammaproteobacteria bacterium]
MSDILKHPWLEVPWKQLLQWKEKDRLPHAILLKGRSGIGKHLLARQFSQWLHCEHPGGDSSCGQCVSCHQFAAGSHPDFLEITPEEDKRVISIDQVRQIGEFLSLSSVQQKQRIVTIFPADCMNVAAMNALLKTLEEPPGNALLILVTNRPGYLAATVRSRCQMMTCPAPSPNQGIDWLKKNTDAEEDIIHLAMQLVDQSPLQALQLLNADHIKHCLSFMDDFSDFLQGKIDHVELARRYEKQDIKDLLYQFLLDILKILSRESRIQDGTAMRIKTVIQSNVQQLQPEKVLRCVDKLKLGMTHASASLNPRLFLEDVLIELV